MVKNGIWKGMGGRVGDCTVKKTVLCDYEKNIISVLYLM